MRILNLVLSLLAALGLGAYGYSAFAADDDGRFAALLEISDAIGPATSDYFNRGLEQATEDGAAIVVLQIDTPGGLDTSMRDMIHAILESPVPVVTYVAPSGSRAASAGTYILYASHVAAMAPATNLGAATPVEMIPQQGEQPGQPGDEKDADEDETRETADSPTAMRKKVVNDAVAYIEGLAELRDRNAEWARLAVREGVSATASEALEMNVIDIVASDLPDLFEQLDGMEVEIGGEKLTLETTGLTVKRIDPDWRSKLLAAITNPNIAYLLLMIGIYGLIFEGSNPGAIVPGVIGAISLLLALYALQALPVNYAGLALIFLGVILIVAEAFVPSFGALGLGGIIAFILGSVILIDTDVPGFDVSKTLIGSLAAFSALLLAGIVYLVARNFRKPVVSGREQLLGSSGIAVDGFDGDGRIRIVGEIWHAHSRRPVASGQHVRVIAKDGLTLIVEPIQEE